MIKLTWLIVMLGFPSQIGPYLYLFMFWVYFSLKKIIFGTFQIITQPSTPVSDLLTLAFHPDLSEKVRDRNFNIFFRDL